MKIAHESPLSIFETVQKITDYDYALVHLFEESEEYLDKFLQARDKGREIILDNSIFELGHAFAPAQFARWVEELLPTWYIVPDALEDINNTIANWDDFMSSHKDLPGKTIGVVQGKSYEEVVECYNFMADRADMVAISFDYSFFEEVFPVEVTKYHKWMRGRQWLIQKMEDEGVIRKDIPHHLLGCGLPQEFAYYRHKQYIYSCDTSNPVVHGMHDIRYKRLPEYDIYGLEDKMSIKLCDLIESEVSDDQIADIIYNINQFKRNIDV